MSRVLSRANFGDYGTHKERGGVFLGTGLKHSQEGIEKGYPFAGGTEMY